MQTRLTHSSTFDDLLARQVSRGPAPRFAAADDVALGRGGADNAAPDASCAAAQAICSCDPLARDFSPGADASLDGAVDDSAEADGNGRGALTAGVDAVDAGWMADASVDSRASCPCPNQA